MADIYGLRRCVLFCRSVMRAMHAFAVVMLHLAVLFAACLRVILLRLVAYMLLIAYVCIEPHPACVASHPSLSIISIRQVTVFWCACCMACMHCTAPFFALALS